MEAATVLATPNVALDLPLPPVGLAKHDPGGEHPDETEESDGATKWKQDVAGGIAHELIVIGLRWSSGTRVHCENPTPVRIAPSANAALVEISAMRVRRVRSLASSRSYCIQPSCEAGWLGAVMTIDAGGDASGAPVASLCWAETGTAVQTTTAKMSIAAKDPLFMGRTLTDQPPVINSEVPRPAIASKPTFPTLPKPLTERGLP